MTLVKDQEAEKTNPKNKKTNKSLPANKKYFLSSLLLSIGNPGIAKDLLSLTIVSENARIKPPTTDKFLRMNCPSNIKP